MFTIIFILLIDFFAFFFIGYGIYVLMKKTPGSYLWNKPIKYVPKNKLKQYNRAISFLYILTGLCFFIVGIVGINFNIRLASLLLIIIISAVIPTLLTIQILFINPQYKK